MCAASCPAAAIGFQQFALRDATVEAPEAGVLVLASVHAKRIAGTEDPRIAVLRRSGDGVSTSVVASAPLPVSAATGERVQIDELHLPVQRGDSVGFLFRAGEIDLGARQRPRPDGAVQSFALPCAPCGMDGGTGLELLLDAVVEPDVDADGMGDDLQDADGGGLGLDWEEDWFEDFGEGDELDEAPGADAARPSAAGREPPDAADHRPQGRARERIRDAARQYPHQHRPVHHDLDRRKARHAPGPRATAPEADAGRRAHPGQAQARANEGRAGVFPAPVDARAADALGSPVAMVQGVRGQGGLA